RAILVSALLFGVFHIVLGGTLAVERLVPSVLMGLALGWVRWRSGSVWPGMLLHASHNAQLLSLELFPTRFAWITETLENSSNSNVPWPWLVACSAGVALGVALVTWGRARPLAT